MSVTDPDYCDHGKHQQERCFFCGRGARKPRAGILPEHRNQPNDEATTSRSLSVRGTNGGKATAAKKARQRGESWADL